MKSASYRPLETTEKDTLIRNGCWTDNWDAIEVADGFDARRVARVVFRGTVRLGRFSKEILGDDGVKRFSGIFDANLANVTVGNDCYISSVGGWISNLELADEVFIEDVSAIQCDSGSTFGNGHPLEVLNEGGGRELLLTALTSSQIAYLSVLYRHDGEFIEALNALARKHAEMVTSDGAFIGAKAHISNCGTIRSVNIGPFAVLSGVDTLEDGTIVSSQESPVTVGTGVVARHFVFQQGARITDGALLTGALIGEAVKVGRQFSGENIVLFANSEAFHSEAVAYFGGPYSVTHHRSTLLIAALTSFYNAGSGTNQSNHLYKLGPVHQGILERGSKTGSCSYLLWPSRIGAFSVVMGKHYSNFDTRDMPFSYINEEDGKSHLVPAMNYFTVGTMRDGEKWPQRDGRKHSDVLDQIIFDVLSPYTAQKMLKGLKTLQSLYAETPREQESVNYQGIQIKRLLLKTCSRYYTMILDKYFGDAVVAKLEAAQGDWRGVIQAEPDAAAGDSDWLDLAGLLCERGRVVTLMDSVRSGRITDQSNLLSEFREMRELYADDAWNWTRHAFADYLQKSLDSITTQDLLAFLEKWQRSSTKLLNMVNMDAGKEFDPGIQIGFGIDGETEADFMAVRGTFEENSFVKNLEDQRTQLETRYQKILAALQ